MAHCGDCKMNFANNSNLRAHVKRKHPGKEDILSPPKIRKTSSLASASSSSEHVCVECNKPFANFGNLRFHVKQKHAGRLEELAPLELKTYNCVTCNAKFQRLKNLIEHTRSHAVPVTIKCPLCQYTGASTETLIMHYKVEHSLEINVETLEFESFEAFQHWKSGMEKETFSSFIKICGSRGNEKHSKIYYKCHRSGQYESRGKNIRHLKTQGSNKIGGFCPAKVTVTISNNKCKVQFCGNHVGHQQQKDIRHLFLTRTDRENIAGKVAAKIPLQTILDEIRDSASNCHLERLHLLTKKDLYNIESSFNLSGSSVRHQNDAISVEAWVNELKVNNSVLFYKPQDDLCNEYPDLRSEDFVLIIMTEGQKELILNFGEDCICVDGTHGLNGYGFELHTILVLDDLREGFPCAFLISNRSDTDIFKIFFSSVEDAIQKKIRPNVFMSDMAEAYYNAWLEIMLPAQFRLFCAWHVDKAWRKNLGKIRNDTDKKAIYQLLRLLLEEREIRAFENKLQNFFAFCAKNPDLAEFAKYFQEHYACKPERWAYCYRVNSGLNMNMHIERMHRTIKHIYLDGKFVTRLDKAIGTIMKFVKDKLFERLIVLHKGKVSTKILSDLRHRHKTSETLDVSKVTVTSEMYWIVPSSSRKEIYVIEEVKPDCNCKIICNECNACMHRYSCTCMDSCIKWNMCKHIHLICRYIQNLPKANQDVEVQSGNVVIDIGDHDEQVEVEALVKSVSTDKPLVKNNLQQHISQEKQSILDGFQQELMAANTLEEIAAIKNRLAPLKPTLAAVRNQHQTSTFVSTRLCSIPENKRIEPQRRLFATRTLKKKKHPPPRPSNEESDTLAIELFYDDITPE